MDSYYNKPNLKNILFDDYKNNIPNLKGKFFAITGTTSGTGYYAARTIGEKGGTVYLLNRKSERSEHSYNNLKSINPKSNYIQIECDLSNFDSVKDAVSQLFSICSDGLDALCNNAGVMALKDQATKDGFDIQMQINHLSHFLLTKLLMPLLEKGARKRGEARIVNHSSAARKTMKKLESKYFEKRGGDLGGNGSMMIPFPGGRWKRYGQTKLANAAFTACLHEKLKNAKSQIKALVAHPGLATTQLQNTTVKDGGMGKWFTQQFMKMGQTPQDGSIGILKCMTDLDAQSGSFYGPGTGVPAAKGEVIHFDLESFYDNPVTKKLLWEKSCEAIGEEFVIT